MKSKPEEEYQEVIKKYTKEGWRFVQIFAPGTQAYGVAEYFELIFKRKQTLYQKKSKLSACS